MFNFNNNDYWKLIFTTIDYYILQYPKRLNDTTISRNTDGEWSNENFKVLSIESHDFGVPPF